MASDYRKNSREYNKHMAKLNEIAVWAINKIAEEPNDAIRTYELAEVKWKAYVRINNSNPKSLIKLYETAFETKMNAYAKELKMRKQIRMANRKNSKGIINQLYSWLTRAR